MLTAADIEQILEQWRAGNPNVAQDRLTILMAGPPGAGKSFTHQMLFHGQSQFLTQLTVTIKQSQTDDLDVDVVVLNSALDMAS